MVSIDIPSGWDADGGYKDMGFEKTDCLISITAPKMSAATFPNAHYLGGRFMPEELQEKYGCKFPFDFEGSDQFFRLI